MRRGCAFTHAIHANDSRKPSTLHGSVIWSVLMCTGGSGCRYQKLFGVLSSLSLRNSKPDPASWMRFRAYHSGLSDRLFAAPRRDLVCSGVSQARLQGTPRADLQTLCNAPSKAAHSLKHLGVQRLCSITPGLDREGGSKPADRSGSMQSGPLQSGPGRTWNLQHWYFSGLDSYVGNLKQGTTSGWMPSHASGEQVLGC